ncbi:hypothetical protein [Leeuwenhoekiella marinoflava]|uniref:Uncharacterized protein n=2 Tax=Leeuwenhoekiella marinoflava TaxID=988 RepID=A0A4V1KQF7_9FLAO|nr:hypothetical protein [Leeuwenhoekiella marinoflava]RXG21252.1 hypothetical protein DSL99_4057 [Leeuwenhoekiella marinoflava]SHG04858.1 hypothetical protein SAMN02745246_04064 [Leeuwenhoekiella marinoflava DSM 3653]
MPKPATYPTLFDEVLQLNITKLKEWGYLKPQQIKSGTLHWSTRGNEIASISIRSNTRDIEPFIELSYNYKNEPRKYRVTLVSIPSNIGKGKIWYFLCPETNKRCRKLYSIGGYFLHREAFKGAMYESQKQSKKWRVLERVYGSYFDVEKYYKELYSKHFKTHYKGKPTKRYLYLKQKIDEAERHSAQDIERLLVFGY